MNGKKQEQVRRDPGRPRGAPELFKSLNVPVEQLAQLEQISEGMSKFRG